MATREEKIATLASSLRASGLARSDGQARMMAEDMVGVEDRVQKQFEEEHTKAQDYLRTTKNLRTPPQSPQPVSSPVKPAASSTPQSSTQSSTSARSYIQPIPTATTATEGSATTQATSGSAKADIPAGATSLRDLMVDQINKGGQDLKPLEDLYEERLAAQKKAAQQVEERSSIDAGQSAVVASPVLQPVQESAPIPQPVTSSPATPSFADPVPEPVPALEPQNVVLDGNKLREMMEEDGPLEEHTREIKEKPKNVKPKEEYAENNIDLANVFNFGKR